MKTVVIFGGTGGIGRELTSLFGTDYIVNSLGSTDVDITDFNSVKSYFDNNEVDVVINLSGYNYDSVLHKINYSEVDKQINVNIKGNINIVACALPQMRDRRFGRIILASSVLADHPIVGTGIYSSCKGFIDSLVKAVSIENSTKNISCNSLQLGYFDAGLTHKISEPVKADIKNSIPFKRWGTIDELYNSIEFLIKTPYITGQNINISGGII